MMQILTPVLAVAAGLTSSALATDTISLTFQPTEKLAAFSFDAPDGHYEDRNVPISCHVNAIRAKMRFSRLGTATTEWTPSIGISLESETDSVTVQLTVDDYKPPIHGGISSINLKTNEPTGWMNLSKSFDMQTPVPVLVTWSEDGLVEFNVDGETRYARANGRILQASVSGSTGAGVIDPLEVGVIAGTDPDATCPHSDK